MQLPTTRGPLTEALVAALAGRGAVPDVVPTVAEPLADDDLQLALWMLYELHYDGFDGVRGDLEWDPDLLRLRRTLEEQVLAALRAATADLVEAARGDGTPLADRLFAMVDGHDGPAVAAYLQREATADQLAEFLAHRSVYNLRETDPQLFAMPRLPGRAQVAMAELVYDEYGDGRPERRHSLLYAEAMAACGLEPDLGVHVDAVPGTTLAVVNVMHLFSLRRDLVAASAGHYGAFEATSSVPSQKVSAGAERLGLPEPVRTYFDEHVEADAVHEQLAFRDICGAVVDADPEAEDLVLLGAAACLVVEAAFGEHLLAAWRAGRSGLLGAEPVGSGKVAS